MSTKAIVRTITAAATLIAVVSLAASLSLAGLSYKSSVPTVNIGQQTATVYEFEPLSYSSPDASIQISRMGTYRGGWFSKKTPGASAYDPITQRFFRPTHDRRAIEVLNIEDPDNPQVDYSIDMNPYGGETNGVAIRHGVVAVIVGNLDNPSLPGKILFMTVKGDILAEPLEAFRVSRLNFTPNGQQLVVTLSGTPKPYWVGDPEGGVAIVDLKSMNWGGCRKGPKFCHLQPEMTIADFQAFNDKKVELLASGVRIFGPGATVAQDLEPAGMTIAPNSLFAYVSLPENNAIAVVDLHQKKITQVIGLPTKDNSLDGNGLDASDKDGSINIQTWPIRSFYQPKDLAAIEVDEQILLVGANEGNFRNYEEARVKDLTLDSVSFPNASYLQNQANLGRLKVSNASGDIDGDGQYEQLYAAGGRSFGVFSAADGHLIYESGDAFEQMFAQIIPSCFNCPADANQFDAQSPNKGAEPEHVTVGRIGDCLFAFVGFERMGGFAVYDITDPSAPVFEQYINNRNFSVQPQTVCGVQGGPALPTCPLAGDLDTEGLVFISQQDSPIGVPLVAMISEATDSTTFFRIDPVPGSHHGHYNRYGRNDHDYCFGH